MRSSPQLDAVLTLNPNHPLANHLYIHAVEASPNPERAMAAADRLRNLQPGLAHNVHMPSHIDIRTGQWLKAVDTNAKAVEADQRYRKIFGTARPGDETHSSDGRGDAERISHGERATSRRKRRDALGSNDAFWPLGRHPR